MRRLALLVCVPFLVALGCTGPEEGVFEEKPPVPFTGKVDDRFVGEWKAEAAESTYSFKKDGAYHLEARIKTPGGTMDTKSDGQWLVDGDRFLIKDQAGNVISYAHKLEGSKLSLSLTGSLKRTTVLNRM